MSKKAELVGNYFGTIYLTVISFLQGIVLSQLVPNIILYTKLADNPWTDIHLLPLVLMLLIIFILWHHYAIGIFFLRWFPNIIDTIIPFVVSIAQFFLLSFLTITDSVNDIDVRSWSIGFMIILLFGCGAYFGAAHRIEADLFANIMSKSNAVTHAVNSKRYYNLGGFSVLIQGIFASLIVLLHQEQGLWISLLFFIVHLTLAEYFLIHTVKPHFINSMDSFDEDK